MAQNDLHRLALLSRLGSVEMVNTFWFREAGSALPADQRATLANDFAGQWFSSGNNNLRNCVNGLVVFHTITVQRYIPYEESVFSRPITADNTGFLSTTNPLPACCAQVITFQTALGGRSGRGRIYLPPPSTGQVSDGYITTTQQSALQAFMSQMNGRYILAGGVAASGFELGVFSRVLGGTSPPFSLAGFHKLSGWVVRQSLRALVRRVRY